MRPGVNPSPYNDFILHNSKRNGNTLLITEEDYIDQDETPPGGCRGQGKFETWSIAMRPGGLTPLDTWMTEMNGSDSKAAATINCSSHWFELSKDLVAVGWYEQGTRFLDVHDPSQHPAGRLLSPGERLDVGCLLVADGPDTQHRVHGGRLPRRGRPSDRSEGRPHHDADERGPGPPVLVHDAGHVRSIRHVAIRVPVDRRRRRLRSVIRGAPAPHPRYRPSMRFAPTDVGFIGDPYRDYEELGDPPPSSTTRRPTTG